MWLKKFKIALIQEDVNNMMLLLDEMPEFDNIEQMKEASYLIEEAFNFANNSKNSTAKSMKQLKKSMQFFNKNENPQFSKLNLSS